MLSINTDINSIKIRNYLSDVTDRLNNSAKRLSTGQKLNSAKDDAAGLYISSGLTPRISALTIGINAAQTGKNISDIAQGAITNMQNAFLRIRDLAVQASSDYYTTEARTAMQNEVNSLIDQITMTKEGCNFNGVNLLDNTAQSSSVGASSGFTQLTIDDFDNVQTITLRGTEIQSGEIDGTTYYLVENVDQLKLACGGQSGEKFVLLSDIDLNGVTWTNYTNNASIDGNGHKISNYHSDADESALIYYNNGTIKNLSMENCSASGNWSAILCCGNYAGSSISNCYVTDSTVLGDYSAILYVGNYYGSSITDCYVTDSTASGNNSAILCRDNYYGSSISNCYVTDSTASGNNSAILCYDNSSSSITDCYVTDSTVSGSSSAILCRDNYYGSSISNCYVTDSTVSGTSSAILCCSNYDDGSISDCYVTDSTVSGNNSAILCRYNGSADLTNTYALNITADSSMNCVNYQGGSVNNAYQNHNESDDTSTYQQTEWFASEDAVTTLGNAYELVEGKDHPTLKSNPEPAPAGSSALRIQTGFDGTTNSYLELDLGFDLGTITVDLSSATAAANSITTIDNYLNLLNDKQSIIGKDYNRLESAAQSNTLEIENMAGAKSIIVDADTAKENSEYIKTQILQNAATSLLAQTVNINSQIVLGLLTSL